MSFTLRGEINDDARQNGVVGLVLSDGLPGHISRGACARAALAHDERHRQLDMQRRI